MDHEWWAGTLRKFRTKDSMRDRREDIQLHGSTERTLMEAGNRGFEDELMAQPLPATLAELKGHPL